MNSYSYIIEKETSAKKDLLETDSVIRRITRSAFSTKINIHRRYADSSQTDPAADRPHSSAAIANSPQQQIRRLVGPQTPPRSGRVLQIQTVEYIEPRIRYLVAAVAGLVVEVYAADRT